MKTSCFAFSPPEAGADVWWLFESRNVSEPVHTCVFIWSCWIVCPDRDSSVTHSVSCRLLLSKYPPRSSVTKVPSSLSIKRLYLEQIVTFCLPIYMRSALKNKIRSDLQKCASAKKWKWVLLLINHERVWSHAAVSGPGYWYVVNFLRHFLGDFITF